MLRARHLARGPEVVGAALAPGGDILIYGCDFGDGETGRAAADARRPPLHIRAPRHLLRTTAMRTATILAAAALLAAATTAGAQFPDDRDDEPGGDAGRERAPAWGHRCPSQDEAMTKVQESLL